MGAALADPGLLLGAVLAGVLWRPTPSAWKPMHQQPPQTPLWRSTSAAKSGQVDASRARVVIP